MYVPLLPLDVTLAFHKRISLGLKLVNLYEVTVKSPEKLSIKCRKIKRLKKL